MVQPSAMSLSKSRSRHAVPERRAAFWLIWLCLAAIVAGAWGYLLVISPQLPDGGLLWIDFIRTLCQPQTSPWGTEALFWALVMWGAMTVAMMLPTAMPMISAYADIAAAARQKQIATAPPVALIAGYLTAWAGFCILGVAAQAALLEHGLLDRNAALNHPVIAGLVLLAAGGYQLSPLRLACLRKCRQPMAYFLSHWRSDFPGVLRMGFTQGLFCLGCCWALMSVMFVCGLMNLLWMAVLGSVMTLEKISDRFHIISVLVTIGLLGSGAFLLLRTVTT